MKRNRLLFYFLYSLFQSIGHGLVIYFVFYVLIARENLLVTSFLNILYIIVGLYSTDKARKFALSKKDQIIDMYKRMGRVTKVLYAASQVSFRPSMYVFYIIVLVISQIAFLEPGLVPYGLGDFFNSIGYGLLILITYDSLTVLLRKEWKWFKENVSPDPADTDGCD